MTPSLDSLRICFEGAIPSAIATCGANGTPNVAWLSQIQYVDARHLALSFQFFSKTRHNILANPLAELMVIHPITAVSYRILVRYQHTQTEGPLFEHMKARLAGVASHAGMESVFQLQGADLYEVLAIEALPGAAVEDRPPRPSPLPALREAGLRIAACRDLPQLVDTTLQLLREQFHCDHAMVLMLDEGRQRLYALASHGYQRPSAGFEVAVGEGIIGVAARERIPIRICFLAPEYSYVQAVKSAALASGLEPTLETEIPFPGLDQPRSQLALPILSGDRLYGVIYLESPEELRFEYDDEDVLMVLTSLLGASLSGLAPENDETPLPSAAPPQPRGAPVTVRHFRFDHSLFLDEDYVIKGLAGAILQRLVAIYLETGRTEFSNRELRLDGSLRLPEIGDNLEARLLLLQRRLAERQACIQMEKTGRGRFRLLITRPLQLEQVERLR